MLYRKADGFIKSFEFQVCQAPTSPRAKIWHIQMISPRFCRKLRIWVPWNKVTKNRRSSHKCTGLWYLHRLSHWIAVWRIKHTKKSVSLPIVWLKLYDFEHIYIYISSYYCLQSIPATTRNCQTLVRTERKFLHFQVWLMDSWMKLKAHSLFFVVNR